MFSILLRWLASSWTQCLGSCCETIVKDGVLGCWNATKINIATYLDSPSTCTDKYCVLTCFNICFFYQYNFRDIWRVQIETSCPAHSGRPCTGAMKPYHLGSPESIMFSSMNETGQLTTNLKISHFTPLKGLRLTASHRPVRWTPSCLPWRSSTRRRVSSWVSTKRPKDMGKTCLFPCQQKKWCCFLSSRRTLQRHGGQW